jgi:hypothetical protein
MHILQPSEARRQFFHLGELAANGPLLVNATVPFVVMPLGWGLGPGPTAPRPEPHHADLDLLGGLALGDLDLDLEPMRLRLQEPEL